MKRLMLALLIMGIASVSFAKEKSCRETAGKKKAAEYVIHCLKASPATHPPCNDANPCSMIIAEINRGCGIIAASAGKPGYSDIPAFCKGYSRLSRK